MAQIYDDSHFKWIIQFQDITLRDCDEIIGKLDKHLRDNPGRMEVEALLFKSFLYVAQWRKPKNKNSKEAIKCLDTAFNKIKNFENDDARNGYSIVGYTLYWQIEGNRQIDSRQNEYSRCIAAIKRTPECIAYIDITRAFALSFLGPKRSSESLEYYKKALSFFPNIVDWLFGFALVCGKKARMEGDREASQTEETVYNKILQKDPNHVLAMVFLAQRKHYKHEVEVYELKSMFNKALELARRDGNNHTKVFTRVAKFYREINNFTQALDILNEAQRYIGEDPHEMLFHQKALVYLSKYRRYDNLKRKTKTHLLPEEKNGDKASLLHKGLFHLTEAIDRCDSGGQFGLDRAYVYEKLGIYEGASDEYIRLVDASMDLQIKDRFSLYLKYGLYLNRRGKEELMMNYLSKGIELFKSEIYKAKKFIYSEVYWAMSFYDRTNASRCSSDVSIERAEAMFRLGWLRLLFSDMTLEAWQRQALSKNNPTRKTPLQLYKQAYEEIQNNDLDNNVPAFLLDIMEGLIICHLKEGSKRNLTRIEGLIQTLQIHSVNGASQKRADLRLVECDQLNGDDRPRLLSEAVQEGSLDACELLMHWCESRRCPSSDPDVLRYCIQVRSCLSRQKLMNRKYNSLGGLFLHTVIDTDNLNSSDISRKEAILRNIHSLLKRKNDDLDELRELYLKLLECRESKSGEAVMIEHCSKVIVVARFALAHAVASFQKRFCTWYTPGGLDVDKSEFLEFRMVKAAAHIKETKPKRKGGQVTTLNEVVKKELKGKLENAGSKQKPMPGFARRSPDLFEYLTMIQPAANPDGAYDWIVAVHTLTNRHKHEERLSQMEYTLSIGKDGNGDIRRTFNMEDLAHSARFGVEKIAMEFRKAEKKFDKFDERVSLRFAELKSLRLNIYMAM